MDGWWPKKIIGEYLSLKVWVHFVHYFFYSWELINFLYSLLIFFWAFTFLWFFELLFSLFWLHYLHFVLFPLHSKWNGIFFFERKKREPPETVAPRCKCNGIQRTLRECHPLVNKSEVLYSRTNEVFMGIIFSSFVLNDGRTLTKYELEQLRKRIFLCCLDGLIWLAHVR